MTKSKNWMIDEESFWFAGANKLSTVSELLLNHPAPSPNCAEIESAMSWYEYETLKLSTNAKYKIAYTIVTPNSGRQKLVSSTQVLANSLPTFGNCVVLFSTFFGDVFLALVAIYACFPISRSAAMRSSIGGWVLNKLLNDFLLSGLAKNKWAVEALCFCIGWALSRIFSSALARPSG